MAEAFNVSRDLPLRFPPRGLERDDVELRIHTLPASSSMDAGLVSEVVELINTVYAVAEEGLWVQGAARTSRHEITDYISDGQITVASLGNRIVGCIRIRQLDTCTSEFGMLAAAESHRGLGLGRQLVAFAEQESIERGLGTMQLELLVPRGWLHPSKEFLAGWYGRIGYHIIRRGAIDEYYPHLTPLLAAPCDFVIYRKDLTTSPSRQAD